MTTYYNDLQCRTLVVQLGNADGTAVSVKNGSTTVWSVDASGTSSEGTFTLADASNIVLGSTTGNKIGTATTQKLGFYNATPIVQPAASADATSFVAGGGTTATSTSTWTGATGASAYTVGGIVTRLKALGLLAA